MGLGKEEYVSKNEVLNLIMHNDKVCHYADEYYENVVYATACSISDVVANMPAADVQPVKRGKWVYSDIPILGNPNDCYLCFVCSVCGFAMDENDYNYCPNCGAKIDIND